MAADATPLSEVRFLTVAEVAAIMRVSKMTVYRLVHSGELEAIRVGRSFRVPEQAVTGYLREAFVARTEQRRRRLSPAWARAGSARAETADGPDAGRCRAMRPGGGTLWRWHVPGRQMWRACARTCPSARKEIKGGLVGSVIKKRRKRMAKKKHRKLLRKTRVQRRNKK